ncbi:MAG: winged helix-turn-helix transcriptional regulator, partial [Clostridia bacterium]|nr:winged helix-turn-helix transcriptional regulator [Clostridia bacterium]
MKFTQEKKDSIIAYILEKVSEDCKNLSKTVSENLGINQTTVHRYVEELLEKGVIVRKKRGQYELREKDVTFILSRAKGDLRSDIAVYERTLEPYVENMAGNVQSIWAYAFTEMINNAIDHSEAETVVVKVRQNPLDT